MRIVFTLTIILLFSICSCEQQNNTSSADYGETSIEFVNPKYRPFYEVGWSKEDMKNARESLEVTSISMERSGCYGSCPVYSVTFRLNGKAIYHGKKHVEDTGKHVGEINLSFYGRLCYLLEEIEFRKLKKEYRAGMTDLSSVTVTVNFKNGDQKKVYDYGSHGPIKFWALTKVIDQIKNQIDWKNKE